MRAEDDVSEETENSAGMQAADMGGDVGAGNSLAEGESIRQDAAIRSNAASPGTAGDFGAFDAAAAGGISGDANVEKEGDSSASPSGGAGELEQSLQPRLRRHR